jgi:hypothetical protein
LAGDGPIEHLVEVREVRHRLALELDDHVSFAQPAAICWA